MQHRQYYMRMASILLFCAIMIGFGLYASQMTLVCAGAAGVCFVGLSVSQMQLNTRKAACSCACSDTTSST